MILDINDKNILNIYMFGSHVYGTNNEHSDTDYIVVVDKPMKIVDDNINLPFETYGTLYSYEELINRLDNDGLYPLESNGPQGPEGLTLIKDIYDCGIKELYVDIEKIHDGRNSLLK